MRPSQKAPSAIGCIKTGSIGDIVCYFDLNGQKAPSAIGCIKTSNSEPANNDLSRASEST